MLVANKFEVLRELGRGAFGVVYEAKDTYLDRAVAIKTIRDECFSSPSSKDAFEKRFLREARSVARLSHPHIIAVYEAGRDGEQSYIAMEFVKGTTLRDVLAARGSLPLPETLHLADALLSALHYAHSQGIIHRDIKPENLMIREDGVLKVADFGIAKALHAESTTLTKDGAVMGTPSYMPPEQVLGKPVDGRSDLFSAAALLYEVLAGAKPFVADTLPGLIHQILTANPKPLSQHVKVPPAVEQVIMRGLAKEPDDRFASCAELRDALLGLAGGGSPTRPTSRAGAGRSEPTVPVPRTPTVQLHPTRVSARAVTPTAEVSVAKSGGGSMMVVGFAVAMLAGLLIVIGVGVLVYLLSRPDTSTARADVPPPTFVNPTRYTPAAPPPSTDPAPMPGAMPVAPGTTSQPMPISPPAQAPQAMPVMPPSRTPQPMPSAAPMNPSDPMAPASGPSSPYRGGSPPEAGPSSRYGDGDSTSRAQAELDAMAVQFKRDFESWNWGELSQYYTQDAVIVNSDGTFRGRDVINLYFATALALIRPMAGTQRIGWSAQWISFESDGSTARGKTLNRMTVGGNVVDSTVFLTDYRKINGRWYVSSTVAQPGGTHLAPHGETAQEDARSDRGKKPKKAKDDSGDADFEFNIPLPKNLPDPRNLPRPWHH